MAYHLHGFNYVRVGSLWSQHAAPGAAPRTRPPRQVVSFHQATQRFAVGTVDGRIVIYDLRTATKSRRALELILTFPVSRYRNKVNLGLAVQVCLLTSVSLTLYSV